MRSIGEQKRDSAQNSLAPQAEQRSPGAPHASVAVPGMQAPVTSQHPWQVRAQSALRTMTAVF